MSTSVSRPARRRRPTRYASTTAGLALVTTTAFALALPPVAAAGEGIAGPALVETPAPAAEAAPVPVSAAAPVAALTATPDRQPPSIPGQPQVLEVLPGAATITWPASTDNVGVTQYYVYQGDQFYSQYIVRIVPDNAPLTLGIGATAASTHFSVAARDAAGNMSRISSRTTVRQPPSFPRTGDNTVPPSAPGAPVATAAAPGGVLVSWEPATDDIGVVEYHVFHSFNIDEVRVEAKVSGNTAVIAPRGGYETIRVVAYDASWNSSSSPTVQFGPLPTPPAPTPAG